ncbi:NarK family nitrate/nitrite MFS transporter [soil metagenome]
MTTETGVGSRERGSEEQSQDGISGPGNWIEKWNPEDEGFWQRKGKKVAVRNLVFSIFAEFLAFSVWQVFSVVAAIMVTLSFGFSTNQFFWLAALPGLSGATLRIPYSFTVPIFGGRNWTLISTALLLLPALGLGVAITNPETPFWVFAVLALLAGFGGGNFASSMANISYFFPNKNKGFALGMNAAGGNIGVSVVQALVPIVIGVGLFTAFTGGSQTSTDSDGSTSTVFIQNAAFIWVPLIALALIGTYFFQNNLHVAKASFKEQSVIFKRKHTWLMAVLYTGTFGSFIGYAAGFPLLITTQFPEANLLYAPLGAAFGSLIRPVGGLLADKFGGARVTFWNFAVMILAVVGVLFFLGIKDQPGAFFGFLAMFLILFTGTGIGNGSTFRMIPVIFRTFHERASQGMDEERKDEASRNGLKEAGAALGFTSAIAAYGAFIIPKSYGTSTTLTGGPAAALAIFIGFYVVCCAICWYFYYRRNADIPC